MAELIVIGYDDEETAAKAAAEVERLAADLIIEPESVAVLTRDMDGRYRVHTNHHPVAEGATWGMLWGALFGLIFFIPLVGFAIGGAMGALLGATPAGSVRALVYPNSAVSSCENWRSV